MTASSEGCHNIGSERPAPACHSRFYAPGDGEGCLPGSLPHLIMMLWPLPLFPPQIISGQQLPKVNKSKNSIVDPKVTIEIHGVQQDNNKKQTKVIENNGKGISSMLCSPGSVTLWLPIAEFSLPRLLPFNQTCPGALKPSHTTQIHEMFLAYFSAGAVYRLLVAWTSSTDRCPNGQLLSGVLSYLLGERNSLQNIISHKSFFEAGCELCRARALQVLFTSIQLDLTRDPTKIFQEKASCGADFISKVSQTHRRSRLQEALEVSVPAPAQSRTNRQVNSSCSGYYPDKLNISKGRDSPDYLGSFKWSSLWLTWW